MSSRWLVVAGLVACGGSATLVPATLVPAPLTPRASADAPPPGRIEPRSPPPAACTGADVDLNRVFEDPACALPSRSVWRDFPGQDPQAGRAQWALDTKVLHDSIVYDVRSRACHVPSGGATDVTITLTNVGTIPVDIVRLAGFHVSASNVPLQVSLRRHASLDAGSQDWWGYVEIAPGGKAHVTFVVTAVANVQEHRQLGSGAHTALAWVVHSSPLLPGTYVLAFALDLNSDEVTFDGRAGHDPPVTLTVDP